jgi:hypothetical protein
MTRRTGWASGAEGRTRRRPSAAFVIACVALTAALGGTSWASMIIGHHASGTEGVAKAAGGSRGPRGFRGPRGRTGARGPAGPAGSAGPAGAAVGFADVAAAGTIAGSKNVQLVSHTADSGLYCLKLTTGTPLNVTAMIDNSGADPRQSFVAGTTNTSAVASACPAGTQFEIVTGDVGAGTGQGDFSDKAFFVAIN